MFIAVEGMDGVGKTTLAKNISKNIDFQYVEKPMQRILNISDQQYDQICHFIWNSGNNDLTLLFFMFGNYLVRYYGENIIADRHLLSSYYWDSNDNNKYIFNYFCSGNVIPELTIVLYASQEVRKERIYKRNPLDDDLNDNHAMDYGYDKMFEFIKHNNIPYVIIDTEDKDEKTLLNYCLELLTNYIKASDNEKKHILNEYNDLFFSKQKNSTLSLNKK